MSELRSLLAAYVGHDYPIRFQTGLPRFRRADGLVDGGTIDFLDELQASQRALHDALDPAWGVFR